MIYLRFSFFLIFALSFLGCKSSKQLSNTSVVKVDQVVLSEDQQRKFDYFFFEANREKMLGNIERSAGYYLECLKIDNRSSAALFELGNIYIADKQYVKAEGFLERAVSMNPDNIWYSYLLGELYQQNGKTSKAIDIYQKLVATGSNKENYLFELAQLYLQEKRYSEALESFNQIERIIGVNEAITIEKQKILLQQGKGKEAIKELNSLIKKFPGEVKYYGYIGDVYLVLNQLELAELNYRKVLDIDLSYHTVYFSLANLYLQQNDTVRFKEYFLKGIQSQEIDVDLKIQKVAPFVFNYKKGQIYLDANDLETIFSTLVSLHPTEQKLFHIYGEFLKNEGNTIKARDLFLTGIVLDEGNDQLWQDILFLDMDLEDYEALLIHGLTALKTHPSNPMFYLMVSSGYLQQNKPVVAIEHLKAGVLLTEGNAALKGQFFSVLGDSYYKTGQVDSSFYYYEEALTLNDKNLMVLNNYAYYLALEGSDLAKAEKMSSRCVEFEPANSTYLDTYAWILFKRGRYLEAKFIIERAIDNGGSDNGVIVEHYGDILYFNGSFDLALAEWLKALDLKPENKELLLEKINSKKYLEKINN